MFQVRLRYYNTKTIHVYKFYLQYLQIRNNTFGNLMTLAIEFMMPVLPKLSPSC